MKLFISSLYVKSGLFILFGLLFSCGVFLSSGSSVSAATCTFASAGTNDFNTLANWDCGFVPGSADEALIPTGTSTSLSAPVTISDLTIQAGATLTTTGVDLNVNNTIDSSGDLVAGMLNTITVGHNFSFNFNGKFYPSDGTVVFTTSTIFGGYIVNAGVPMTFNNLIIQPSRPFFFNSPTDYTVTGFVSSTAVINIVDLANVSIQGDLQNGNVLFLNGSSASLTVTGTTTNAATGTIRPILGTVTFNGDLVNDGSLAFLVGETGNFHVNAGLTGTGSVSDAGPGTFTFGGTGSQTIPAGLTFANLTVAKPALSTLTLVGDATTTGILSVDSGQLLLGANTLRVQGNFFGTASGSVNSGTGTYLFDGSGSQIVGNPSIFAPSVYKIRVNKPSGTLTVGALGIIQHSLIIDSGVLNASSAQLTVRGTGSAFLINGGSFQAASGTVVYDGSGTTVASTTYNNLSFNPGSILATYTLSASTTVLGNITIGGTTSTLNLAGNTLRLGGNWTNTGTLIPAGGVVELFGGSNQSIGAEPNFNFLDVSKSTGTATLVGNVTANRVLLNGGTLNGGSVTLSFSTGTWSEPLAYMGGAFVPGTGTVVYNKSVDTNSGSTVFNNLQLLSAGHDHVLSASTTVLGVLTVTSTASLSVGSASLTALGTIQNLGLVSVNTSTGGTVIHRPESIAFTSAGFVSATSFSLPANLFFSIQDSNRNLNGSLAESFTVTITNAAGDSETKTLTETGLATGIFHSATALAALKQTPATQNDSVLAMPATGLATLSYSDPSDTTDTTSTAVTLTAPASSGSSNSGGGGGGGGGSAIVPVTSVFMTTAVDPKLLEQLKSLGILVHSLVKVSTDSAVYYIGADGKRHAFPNDKAFFTWYCDFSGVQTISAEKLAAIPLGANVSYRPGFKMVKFTTDPKVYLVTLGGVLRHVPTEAVAKALFGSFWNKYVDDISDAFYVNYTFGLPLNAASDVNLVGMVASVSYPGDSLNIAGVTPTSGVGLVCTMMDADKDGLSDAQERTVGTDPTAADTDGDGYTDGQEVQNGHDPLKAADMDADGLSDMDEVVKYKTNPNKFDTDGDGYSDGIEVQSGHNPLAP